MRNRQFVFTPKIEYKLVADLPAGKAGRSEANISNLQFPTWCSILELVRTAFAAAGGEEVPPRKFGKTAPARRSLGAGGEPYRSKPQKNPEKNTRLAKAPAKRVGSNHVLILGEENFLIMASKINY